MQYGTNRRKKKFESIVRETTANNDNNNKKIRIRNACKKRNTFHVIFFNFITNKLDFTLYN